MLKKKDVKHVISREKRYSTEAKQEGDYAKKQATIEKKRGLKEMARVYLGIFMISKAQDIKKVIEKQKRNATIAQYEGTYTNFSGTLLA